MSVMAKKLNHEIKEKMVSLTGACFWFWDGFYSFLDSCGVSKPLQKRYPRESYNKYQTMRNILTDLDGQGQMDVINDIASGEGFINGSSLKRVEQEKTAFRVSE